MHDRHFTALRKKQATGRPFQTDVDSPNRHFFRMLHRMSVSAISLAELWEGEALPSDRCRPSR